LAALERSSVDQGRTSSVGLSSFIALDTHAENGGGLGRKRSITPDDTRQMPAERVVANLWLSGFEIDEAEQVMRKRPPSANHS
jgi:hypothetical protein